MSKINNLDDFKDLKMTQNNPQWFSPNHDLNTAQNIIFLNTEAFSNYMAQFNDEEIKPLRFDSDKELRKEPVCLELKTKLHIVKDSE